MHDAALARGQHGLHRRAGEQEGCIEVDAIDAVEILQIDLMRGHARLAGDAGAIDQHLGVPISAAILAKTFSTSWGRRYRRDCESLLSVADGSHGLLEQILLKVDADDAVSLRRQSLGYGEPDAARRAGDDRDPLFAHAISSTSLRLFDFRLREALQGEALCRGGFRVGQAEGVRHAMLWRVAPQYIKAAGLPPAACPFLTGYFPGFPHVFVPKPVSAFGAEDML